MNDEPGSRPDTANPTLSVAVVVQSGDWPASLPQHEALAQEAVRAALAAAGFSQPCELCVSLGDDALLQSLNRDYRDQDKPTNVLAFALNEAAARGDAPLNLPEGVPLALGDIVISLDRLLREAGEQGKSPRAHFRHLVVHGALHLLGYDHQEDDEAEAMEALETKVLAGLGEADPYANDLLGGVA